MISICYRQPSRLIARGAQHLPDKRSRTSTNLAAPASLQRLAIKSARVIFSHASMESFALLFMNCLILSRDGAKHPCETMRLRRADEPTIEETEPANRKQHHAKGFFDGDTTPKGGAGCAMPYFT